MLANLTVTLLGYYPPFFLASGPTLLRQAILGSSVFFFAVAAIIFGSQYLRGKSASLYWYALAIGLFSVGLFSSFETKAIGDVPTWLGRIALYVGTVYLTAAILLSNREVGGTDRASGWASTFKPNPEQLEALFSNLLDSFIYGKIVLDKEGKPIDWIFLDVNDSYGQVVGLKRDQIIGKRVSELYPDEHNDPVDWISKYGHVALTGEPLHFEGYRQSLKKWLHVSSYSPKKGYFIAIFDDVTERKKAEEAMRATLDRFYNSLSRMYGAILLVSAQGTVEFANQAFCDYFLLKESPAELKNLSSEAIIEKIKDAYLHPDEEVFRMKEIVTAGKPVMGEEIALKGNRTSLRDFIPLNEKGSSFSRLWHHIDISERKKAEEALLESELKYKNLAAHLEEIVEERTRQLKDSERLAAIGATAGMVGHDIRNPLQAITGDLYLVKTELAELPDHQQKKNAMESIDEIQNNIDYINKIVADLQDYARPLNPRAQEANIKSIFNETVKKNGIPKNIEVTTEVEDKAERIMADPDYLKRIVSNLTLNAVQAMPNGGKLTIRAFADKKTNDVLITVKDTGVGIPEDVKPKLFTPMMTTKSKGQGFGLAVVKRMSEGLGGTVTFESTEGKGTTFIVRLPPPKELNGKWTYK